MKERGQGPSRKSVLIAGGLALVVLSLGLLLSQDFGQGWDDSVEAPYGKTVSSAYSGSHEYFQFKFQSYLGPGYQLLQYLLSQELHPLLPSWKGVHIRYLVNFLFFQLGVVSLYFLARRFLPLSGALLAAALFISQPLLFGHAFINHKDGIFLCLFTASVASGLAMADAFSQEASTVQKTSARQPATKRAGTSRSDLLAPSLLILIALIDGLFGFSTRLAVSLVTSAYQGTSLPALNALFTSVAEQRASTPLSAYIEKVSRLSLSAHALTAAVGVVLLVVAVLGRLPRATRVLYLRRFGLLLLAAASLGLATATRLAGPLAGILVAIYLILKVRQLRAVPVLVAYVITSYAVTIGFWPALWRDPIGHLFEAVRVLSYFPGHEVLFMGKGYLATDLPWFFLPVSIAVQLTEPALFLLPVAALAITTSYTRNGRGMVPLSLLPIVLWVAIPVFGVALFRLPNFNSFRHYLFVTPPLIILAAIGAWYLLERVRSRLARLFIVTLILVPGVVSILRLHPYEYVYYNSIVGGVAGADGQFELDYWCTSYKEAIEFVNQEAPSGARVTVWGPVGPAATFSREDLTLLSEGETTTSPDYAIAAGPMARSPTFYETYDTVFEVTANGAVLARVKRAPSSQE